ncbi:S8 family peptidase [Rathayibacter rathayi]|uniref:Serine protease n=1 Tax=Rathayibacter rathayi TaxID=33887 RepID=A0ABD6W8B6_RATRA|nr:S8 family peptidase [Rathayibacter rathayi]AZZ48177.1 serine protease [Rathayibacter rathayi]MWV75457.1 S8 family serine peptidase [Rathayibacter rathayi NCPPB 2980 = VKM Ac-1601]PPF13707.1 serine protease [Rathayibacter rathayi]PPF23566.1 serine protease [Rathayibacter rathayi]PPF48381.1 serine protease [Rathayibacter rathayi]
MPIHFTHRPSVRRPDRRILAGLALLGVAATTAFASTGASAVPLAGGASLVGGLSVGQSFDDGDYVVTLVEPSAATYQGTDARFARTAPVEGSQLQAASEPVEDYSAHLERRQQDVASAVDAAIGYHYTVALNGFSASLSGEQAGELANRRDVAQVRKVENLRLDGAARTSPLASAAAGIPAPDTGQQRSTDFLGLEGEDGVWQKLGGVDKAGAGVVVGVIDSGIAPENPSFAGAPLATSPGAAPSTDGTTTSFVKSDGGTFVGSCSPGLPASEQWDGHECNQKLISARWFLGDEKVGSKDNPEYHSPRDAVGHGSHTASTAAGNNGVEASVDGYDYGRISGVAPAAKIAAYKACWNEADNSGTSCSGTGMLAAVDAATKDGVDVINFSIGGGSATTTLSVLDEAFLNAAAAGVFIAVSAGNSGSGASTLDHASPWYTTVAASSIPTSTATATLGDGQKFVGASISVHKDVTGPLVNSADVVRAGTKNPTVCEPGTLDPDKVTGAVVACTSGVTSRFSKSAEVERAGGIGMLLINSTPNALDVDDHLIPSIQIDSQAYNAITDYAGTAGATVKLSEGNSSGAVIPVPQVVGFSSRGPAEADGSDVLKPDLTAPGVGILADFTNLKGEDPAFAFESGTSMSSPHVAGLGALILGAAPKASPSAVKSAMMTSAYNSVNQSGAASEDVFAQGAGHVDPAAFLDPGLIYESGATDWTAFLKGAGYAFTPTNGIEAIDPSDLNQASIAIGSLAGKQTVTRTVTSTGAGTYTASVDGLAGVDAVVSPSTLSFTEAGQKAKYTVSFTTGSAPLTQFATGYLTWASSEHDVRSPIAVRPILLSAPHEMSGTGSTGTGSVTVTPGITGSVPLAASGLAQGVLAQDATAADGHSATLPAGKSLTSTVVVPEGAEFARFDLDSVDSTADLDLTVTSLSTKKVFTSATGSADERVDIADPAPGEYTVRADVYSTAPGSSTSTFDLRSFLITPENGLGSLSTDSAEIDAVQGEPATYAVSWSNLAGPARYLGRVVYDDSGLATLVSVDVTEAVPPAPAPNPAPESENTSGSTMTPTVDLISSPGEPTGSSALGYSAGGLPSTGFDGGLLGAAAVALLGTGAVITVLRRRALARQEAASAE